MNFKTMRYISAVNEYQSFTEASAQLHISQPSLSQSIKSAEQELGIQLFDRFSKPIKLTQAGEIFLTYSQKILTDYDNLQLQLAKLKTSETSLRVCVSSNYMTKVIPYVLKQFINLCPDQKVILSEQRNSLKILEDIRNKKLDFAVFGGRKPDDSVAHLTLSQDRIIFVVPNEYDIIPYKYKDNALLPVEQIGLFQNIPFVMAPEGHPHHKFSMELCQRAGFFPQHVLICDTVDSMYAMAAAGLGVTFILSSTLRLENHRFHAVHYYVEPTDFCHGSYVVFPKEERLSEASEKFIEILKDYF